MEKPFKVHNVRPIINKLMNPNIKDEDRISFSRAVEKLNEIAFKYQCEFKSRYKKKNKTELTDLDLKWLLFYGKTTSQVKEIVIDNLGQIDWALNSAFDLLDKETYFNEPVVKDIFWKRIRLIAELNLTALDELKKSE